jgi:hypothetical protein
VQDAFESWWRLSIEGSDNRSGASLRPTTRALYLWTWTAHVSEKWAARKLLSVSAEEVAPWQQELLSGGLGPKTTLNCVQLLGSLFKHARRFQWIPTNPCEDVRRPRYKVKVRAFTGVEVATITQAADETTTLAGHHSAAFTLDQYADALPQQLEEAGEKVSTVLLEASGSILVAQANEIKVRSAQVIEFESAPGEIRTPDPQVRSQIRPLPPTARCYANYQICCVLAVSDYHLLR